LLIIFNFNGPSTAAAQGRTLSFGRPSQSDQAAESDLETDGGPFSAIRQNVKVKITRRCHWERCWARRLVRKFSKTGEKVAFRQGRQRRLVCFEEVLLAATTSWSGAGEST